MAQRISRAKRALRDVRLDAPGDLATVHFLDPVPVAEMAGLMAGADAQLVSLADDPLFTEADLYALRSVARIVREGDMDEATVLSHARAFARTADRLAAWQVQLVAESLAPPGEGDDADWWRVAATACWRHLDATGQAAEASDTAPPAPDRQLGAE